MKGFVRIMEAILASLVLLAATAYFFEPIVKYSSWSDTLTRIEVEDALMALHVSGNLDKYVNYQDLDEFEIDKNYFNGNLSEMLQKTIDFSIEVNGRPNPLIFIGCNCTSSELTELNSMLEPLNFSYKGREIEIRIKAMAIDAIESQTNILFLFGYKNLGVEPYIKYIESFMEKGGTVFMLADLSEGQINDGFMNETFGLKWVAGAVSSSGEFYYRQDVNKTSYRIANYFVNISGLDRNESFTLNANNIEADYRTVVGNGTYSLIKINELIKGRTAWFADCDKNDVKIRNLTKAMVLWASGESYRMDETEKRPPNIYKSSQYIAAGEEPYEINLIFWRVFY